MSFETDVRLIIGHGHILKSITRFVRLPARVRARSTLQIGTTGPGLESTQRPIITAISARPPELAEPVKSLDPGRARRRSRYWSIDLDGFDNRRQAFLFRRRQNRSAPRRVWPVEITR